MRECIVLEAGRVNCHAAFQIKITSRPCQVGRKWSTPVHISQKKNFFFLNTICNIKIFARGYFVVISSILFRLKKDFTVQDNLFCICYTLLATGNVHPMHLIVLDLC